MVGLWSVNLILLNRWLFVVTRGKEALELKVLHFLIRHFFTSGVDILLLKEGPFGTRLFVVSMEK